MLVEEFSGDRLNESDNEGEDEQEDPLALEATNASEKDKEKVCDCENCISYNVEVYVQLTVNISSPSTLIVTRS